MSQINVRNLSNENDDGAPDIVGVSTFSATSYIVPPVGTTKQRPENPQPGDLRFNTDTASLEYYKGNTIGWTQIEMTSPDLDGGARGLAMGGEIAASPYGQLQIDYFNISTLGNGQDFGDLTVARGTAGACASRTRGLCMSGYQGGYHNVIDYVTISSLGDALNFGDLPVAVQGADSLSNAIRAVITSGSEGTAPAYGQTNVLSYITIATTSNTQDFGDLTRNYGYGGTCSSSTRGLFAGGYDTRPTVSNTIDYITIASTGNSKDFGDFQGVRRNCMGISNSIRGVFAGGLSPTVLNNIEYVTIATTGNGTDFGDLSTNSGQGRAFRDSGMASPTRGLFVGGNYPGSPAWPKVNTVDYIEIATTGNSKDFGDLSVAQSAIPGCSNAHGGL